nr:tetratricopeptide repeat protein [Massilia eurypsychrophila]
MDTLGWICVENGDLARALPLLQKASALAPDASEIRYHFGLVLARSGDKRGARRELERLLASTVDPSRRAEAKALLATL